MSIEQSSVVDAIGIDKLSGALVLTISDHLEWGDGSDRHLTLLQEKINTYLAFVESGEVFEAYPDARARPILIDLIGKYPVSDEGIAFLAKAQQIVRGAGMTLQYRLLHTLNS